MFRKILYPTDFSENSERALPYIQALRGSGAEEVVVLHVIDEREVDAVLKAAPWYGRSPEEMRKDYVERVREEMKDSIEKVKKALESVGLKVNIKIVIGRPYRQILRAEEEEDVSLTVIGSHGKSNIVDMIFGSVSEKVIREAKRPVLVIKRWQE